MKAAFSVHKTICLSITQIQNWRDCFTVGVFRCYKQVKPPLAWTMRDLSIADGRKHHVLFGHHMCGFQHLHVAPRYKAYHYTSEVKVGVSGYSSSSGRGSFFSSSIG